MVMAKLDTPEVADLLLEIGRRASLEGGNPYKAKAYVRAAESLRHASRPLAEIIRRGELRQIPGAED
jgi:DNA polymerase (family X)